MKPYHLHVAKIYNNKIKQNIVKCALSQEQAQKYFNFALRTMMWWFQKEDSISGIVFVPRDGNVLLGVIKEENIIPLNEQEHKDIADLFAFANEHCMFTEKAVAYKWDDISK